MQKSSLIKKNLLDLEYTKTVQYLNTTIVIIFTYAVGVAIASLSKQIDYGDAYQAIALISSTAIVLSVALMVAYYLRTKIEKIKQEIQNVEL